MTSYVDDNIFPKIPISGLTGSTQAMRFVGMTASGAPTTGPHLVGDTAFSLATGIVYVCTVAGTPGTFAPSSATTAGVVQLAQTKVPSGTAASFSFSSISSAYTDLEVVISGRGDVAAAATNVILRLNSDSGANYDYEDVQGNTTSVTVHETLGATSINAAVIPGSTAPSGVADAARFTIHNYADTNLQKAIIGQKSDKRDTTTTNIYVYTYSAWWRSAAAVNAISLTPSSGNFVAGSVATLYGRV